MQSILYCLILFSSTLIHCNTQDPQRPQYHFTATKNWINDPNGPMYFNGFYHLFYQYNPTAAVWGDMHWGHAISEDLIHWTHLPMALYPDKSYDSGGVFSGSITITPNGPVIIYTGQTQIEVQCVAFPLNVSDPLLLNWTKSNSNPVIQPPLSSLIGFRDPTTAWIQGDTWYILVGGGFSNSGAILRFSTTDFINWNYENIFYSDVENQSLVCECPDFYPLLGDTWLLKYSSTYDRYDYFVVGQYDGKTFTPQYKGIYDFGAASYYASKTFYDNENRRQVLLGWSNELDDSSYWIQRGWAGCHAIPRVVSVIGGQVTFNPVPELQQLRTNYYSTSSVKISDGVLKINEISGDQLEILFYITVSNSPMFGVDVRTSPDLQEMTRIFFNLGLNSSNNTDEPGLDYKGIHMHQDEIDSDCQNLCIEDPKCLAWTYIKPGMRGPDPWCFLKNPLPAKVPNNCCISGSKAIFGVNRTLSSLENSGVSYLQMGSYSPTPTDGIVVMDVRVLVDHSVIEVFVNGGTSVLTTRVYPTRNDSIGIQFFSFDGTTVFDTIEIWILASAAL